MEITITVDGRTQTLGTSDFAVIDNKVVLSDQILKQMSEWAEQGKVIDVTMCYEGNPYIAAFTLEKTEE